MRIRIHLKTKEIPIHYRMMVLSLIKEAIRTSDEKLYQRLYLDNASKPKTYSFAVYLSNLNKKENVFEVDGASVTISSSNPEIAVSLINGFQQMKKYSYQKWTLQILKVELLKEKTINSSVVKFVTNSPLLLEDKDNKPLLITSKNFEEEANIVSNKQFLSLYGRTLKRPIKIKDFNMKKQVIQESNSHANGQTLFYTCQKGFITLEGDIEDLKLIYQDGYLLRKSQGMGQLEVVKSYGSNCSE
ncbi:hypothetical protein CD30_00855 [Ureibacillus massiliensis 4400831 = CIP 108448 = CCUG 49529]|uniref:CRISPR associated protein Cas6 C-terminal domain-containing protein n=1 Tax=Ureibacillus massiliensis 4400831 = CIP 108448 = CCUG 49529 TaxID=1211035 RepID=A0A0A3JB47_9BACL|nr:CRISPR-associated endoribonuclease Cas6 [Ureibacillus massiliensis]KGR92393.1 hypothetical protein CD30_00855 [Ureibacillus massiliensis 4400831 = CIP 108448 = CCUG 49529]